MARRPRNYSNHIVIWDGANNSITFRPQYRNSKGRYVENFGLGNSIISFNMDDLPSDGLIVPITDETTGQGIMPTSPFKLRRWYSMPENLSEVSKTLTGYNNWQGNITFKQANGGSVKEVTSVPIKQNGYGCEEIVGDATRLNW